MTNILTSETNYLQPSQTFMIDDFCKNSQLFLQKRYITDVRLGSKYASIPYMIYLSKNVSQHQEDGRWTST